jgi:formylglycine-generating enzyme
MLHYVLGAIGVVTAALFGALLQAAPGGCAARDVFLERSAQHGPEMVSIPANTFLMGSDPAEFGYSPDEPRHRVELSSFAIGRYEVTNAEFAEFLNEQGNQVVDKIPWLLVGRSKHCQIERHAGLYRPLPGYEKHPVVTVSWAGARAYCRWLSLRTGRTYRLPTEAQWEDAARAGSTTFWDWGNQFAPDRLNWRGHAAQPAAMPVGSFAPNAWGIHDMTGNVWEWVLDAFDPLFYLFSPLKDPVLFEDDDWAPGVRGGSFRDSSEFCRPGYRANVWWWGDYDSIGFRVARDKC